MRKISTLFVAFAAMVSHANAQITVTNSTFVQAGDNLKTFVAADPSIVNITPGAGTAQTWDFTALTDDGINEDSILTAAGDPIASVSFPSADIIVPLFGLGTGYADITNTQVKVIGGAANFFGNDFIIPVNGNIVRQYAPINFGSTTNFTGSFSLTTGDTAIMNLVNQFITQVPLITGADSVRVTFQQVSSNNVDAYGTCIVPTGTFDVLRIHQTNTTNTIIEARVIPIFGGALWFDITPFIEGAVGGQLPIQLGQDTTETYIFRDANSKEAIVEATMAPNGDVGRALYKFGPIVNTGLVQNTLNGQVSVFPNPSSDVFTVKMGEMEAAEYTVQLFDQTGRSISQSVMTLQANSQFEVPAKQLATGVYFLRLSNGKQSAMIQLVKL